MLLSAHHINQQGMTFHHREHSPLLVLLRLHLLRHLHHLFCRQDPGLGQEGVLMLILPMTRLSSKRLPGRSCCPVIHQLKLGGREGWYYTETSQYIRFVASKIFKVQLNYLTFRIFCNKLRIIFGYSDWSKGMSHVWRFCVKEKAQKEAM